MLRTARYTTSYPGNAESQKITRGTSHCLFFRFNHRSRVHRSYIKALHGYLASFLRRSQPLVDYESQRAEQEADFEKKWETGETDGWEDNASSKAEPNDNQDGIWCSACE